MLELFYVDHGTERVIIYIEGLGGRVLSANEGKKKQRVRKAGKP